MGRKSVELLVATHPEWVKVILENFDEFLQDHANCERKASALAMSLIVKYPDRIRIIPDLVDLAMEELTHFSQVYELMRQRGVSLVKDTPDPYVNALIGLMRHGRDVRFLDRMLVSSVIECRGAERFGIIAESVPDPELRNFYLALWKSERKHGHQFVDLVLRYFEPEEVYPRLEELMAREGEIIEGLEWRPSLH